jgi:hypothetical protein
LLFRGVDMSAETLRAIHDGLEATGMVEQIFGCLTQTRRGP